MKDIQFAVPNQLTSVELKQFRKKMNLTQNEMALLANVSRKTIERWESEEQLISGPVVTLVTILREYPQIKENLIIPRREYPLRLIYMYKEEISTIIDVDEKERKIQVWNYTNNYILRAFGKIEKPTYEQFEEFLESRCFPRTRDKMKLMLEELELPFYDPLMIIEKTQGRMAEDNCWIRIERDKYGKII